jgi:hypothetical protein
MVVCQSAWRNPLAGVGADVLDGPVESLGEEGSQPITWLPAKRIPAPAHDIGIWVGAYKPRILISPDV